MKRLGKHSLLLGCLLGGFQSQDLPAVAGSIERNVHVCKDVGLLAISEEEEAERKKLEGVLCQHDRLTLKARALIHCKDGPKREWLEPGTHDINQICKRTTITYKKCKLSLTCGRNDSKMKLIGNTIVANGNAPELRWHSIGGSEGYEIIIKPTSTGRTRRYKTNEPTLRLDFDMEPGEFYAINIYAMGTNVWGKFVYIVLSQEENTQLNRTLDFIGTIGLPEEDKVLYLDSVYTSYGLLQEAIATLDNSTATQSSLTLKRKLAHRLGDAGYFSRAIELFKSISQIATEGSTELIEAEMILEDYR